MTEIIIISLIWTIVGVWTFNAYMNATPVYDNNHLKFIFMIIICGPYVWMFTIICAILHIIISVYKRIKTYIKMVYDD